MKKRLKFVLLILIAVPLVLQLWLLQHLVNSNSVELRQEYEKIRLAKLNNLSDKLAVVVDNVSKDLLDKSEKSVYSKGFFWVTEEGKLLKTGTESEELLKNTAELWRDNKFLNEVINRSSGESQNEFAQSGWLRFFDGTNMKMYFWQSKGALYLVNRVNYAAVLADFIAVLPDGDGLVERWSFHGLNGDSLYSWGKLFEAGKSDLEKVVAKCSIAPFEAYNLQIALDRGLLPETRLAGKFQQNIYYLAAVMAVCFCVLGFYFYYSSNREFREAQTKVSFVNRVSHELKTPLANICLYSELMADKVGDDEGYRHYLQVINSESGRLSRLIHNILSFSNQSRGMSQLRMQEVDLQSFFDEFLEPITFPLRQKGVEAIIENNCHGLCRLDGDLVKQVLGNLISNVEKYALDGKLLKVVSCLEGDTLQLSVEDRGEGIPEAYTKKVFNTFFRCDNSLSAGVS